MPRTSATAMVMLRRIGRSYGLHDAGQGVSGPLPLRGSKPAGRIPDPSGEGAALIRRLSREDLGEPAVRVGGKGRIHFAHLRNVKVNEAGDFEETAHKSDCGSLDMAAIVKAYHDVGYEGYARPDHGRMIWGETGKPGYGLYDRALGAVYLNGLWEAMKYAPPG